MNRLAPLPLTLSLLLLTAVPWSFAFAGSGSTPELGKPQIVGGSVAAPSQGRWIVSIQRNGHFCGASLVAPRWVVTAAHCVIGEKAKKIRVWVGGNDLGRPSSGITAKVKKIHLHANYNDRTLRNDIALLELQSAIPGSVPAARLADAATTSELAKPGKTVTVSGWGALSENGGSPDLLHQVRLPVVSNGECNAGAAYGGQIVSSQLCAGLRQGGKDACYGDSGGPLWASRQGEDYLIGVVSWGEGCARPRKYGVYTRVSSFRSWIDSKLAAGGGGGDEGGGGGGGGSAGSARSCRGKCGGNAGRCWCDADCRWLGDCCRDFQAACGGATTSCTTTVCEIDRYCCDVEWDDLCEDLAADAC